MRNLPAGSRSHQLYGQHALSEGARAATLGHVIITAVLIGYTAVQGFGQGDLLGWSVYWCALGVLLALTPMLPQMGLVGFVGLAYGTPRYIDAYEILLNAQVIQYAAAVLLAGWGAWLLRARPRQFVWHPLSTLLIFFLVWIALTSAVSIIEGTPWKPSLRHNPAYLFQALVLFIVGSQVLGDQQRSWQVAWGFCAILLIRAIVQGGGGLHLEGDIGPLAAMAIPLALLGCAIATDRPLKVTFAFLIVALSLTVGLTQNRAAGLALMSVLLVWWLHSERKWRLLIWALPVLAVGAVLFVQSNYWDRFSAIWGGGGTGLDRATIQERLDLWRAGWRMILDNPWFGVGPGNYNILLADYLSPKYGRLVAHNSFIHIGAETGVTGLVLYGALFCGGLVIAQRTIRRAGNQWPGHGARAVQASLAGYLTVSLFISRHDLALAYLVLGWAVALSRSARPGMGMMHEPIPERATSVS